MNWNPIRLLGCLLLIAGSSVSGQEMPEFPAPQAEHEWLKQFVGEWESKSKSAPMPDQEPMECQGKMTSRMLGGFWVISESTGNMQGAPFKAIQTIGYDPMKEKYIGTWVDSMIGYMWHYEGNLDESGKILSLEAEGPDFMFGRGMTKYRDSYEFKSKDHIVATSSIMNEEGEWVTFMTGHLRRTK
ncbi:Secreted protein containing DUF1579 [Planctomycetales bacterium 10988]|nr:Secreted protein containing DUF1579 [Planctomycetales bacterium 10988]